MLRAMFRLTSSFVVRCALAGAVLSCGAAWAAPESGPHDPVAKLLSEKGLIDPAGAAATPAAPPPVEPAASGPAAAAAPPTPPQTFTQHVRETASGMVLTAMNFLGVPYRRGGTDADSGFDCSGFTRHIFESSLGLVLPRRADEQAHAKGLLTVKRDELKPGDLVFFNTLRRTFSHVGIYIGEGKFIHAPKPGGEVRVEDMRFAYWAKRFTGARRASQANEPVAAEAPLLAEASTSAAALPEAMPAVLPTVVQAVAPVAATPSKAAPKKAVHKTRRKPARSAVKA